MIRFIRRGSAVAALLALAPYAAGGVLVVDLAGGGDYLQIADAIAAAADGDTILVKPGTYAVGYVISGKGLTLVADQGADVLLYSPFLGPLVSTIENLQPDQTVVIRGIDGPLNLQSNLGAVRVEDCQLKGKLGFCHPTLPGQVGGPGASVTDCASVAFARCAIAGGDGFEIFQPGMFACCSSGGTGLAVNNAHVALYDTTVIGGQATLSCQNGPSLVQSGTPVQFDPAPAYDYVAPSPIRQGQAGSLHFAGAAGDVALLVVALEPLQVTPSCCDGVLLVQPSSAPLTIGALPAPAAAVDVPFTAPLFGIPGLQAIGFHTQALYARPSGFLIAAPSIVTVLDPSF